MHGVIELRKTLMLPLDDLLAVTREFVNAQATRAALARCLARHGVGNLRQMQAELNPGAAPVVKTFKSYESGFVVDPRRGRGMFNTFHASYPFFRFPLDHVFHSAAFSLVTMQRLSSIGSDHFPILVELQLDKPSS